ncbi:T9SS type A sorting domain-containing protein [Empedobacter tilapiae]
MKKNLLALFALSAIYSASAQTTYIKDKAVVVVKSNTLLYMGNGLEVSSSTPNTVINEGNILINLSSLKPFNYNSSTTETSPYYFKNFNTDGTTYNDGSNFVNKFIDNNSYGQLMFYSANGATLSATLIEESTNRIKGRVTMEKKYVNPSNYNWLPISIPFDKRSLDKGFSPILQNSFGISSSQYIYNNSNSNSRYLSTLMNWVQGSEYYNSTVGTETELFETTVNILNLTSGALKNIFANNYSNPNARITYKGVPYGGARNIVYRNTVAGQSPWSKVYTPTDKWGVWKNKINPANEKYGTYIGESFEIMDDESVTYGKYQINFANPFTHNLDLANLFSGSHSSGIARTNIKAVTKPGTSVTWKIGVGNTTPINTNYMASVPTNTTTGYNPALTNRQWTGDKEALLLRPFEIATFKTNDVAGSYQYFSGESSSYATNNPKTFNYASGATITSTTPIPRGVGNVTEDIEASKENYNENSLYQLGLVVSNNNDTQGNRVYFVAVDSDITGKQNEFELEYGSYGSNSGLWLNQENKDETFDEGSFLFINGFNMNDYVAKPLHMTFYKNPKDTNTKFTLTANLAEGSTLNDGLEKFSNGNKFYFVDTKENKAIEITKDFSYTFTANESSNNRFIVYWNELPSKLGTGEIGINKNKTFIYRNNVASNSIRFAKKNLTANIVVYNMTGQKIYEKDNLSTSQDFNFNNIENGMYIINITYSDNTTETLKSIFKK